MRLLMNYTIVWTLESADEPNTSLEVKVREARFGDQVILTRVSLGGLVRRTLVSIQIASFLADQEDSGTSPTLRTTRAIAEHLRLRGWVLSKVTLNTGVRGATTIGALFHLPVNGHEFQVVADKLPAEYRAAPSEIHKRLTDAHTSGA